MTVEIALVFIITGLALYLFVSERLPLDVTAILILVVVTAIPQLFHSQWLINHGVDLQSAFPTPQEGLSGLSSSATVTVLAMFILSAGIQRTGLVYRLGQLLSPWMKGPEWRQLLIIAVLVGPISGLINNTATVAIAMPLVLSMAHRSGARPARLLLPMSYLAIMGGTLTLIGTSTNLLASSIIANHESFGRELGMFEFSQVGLVVMATGVLYFLTVGRFLLPEQRRAESKQSEDREDDFIFEVRIKSGSQLIGTSFRAAGFGERSDTQIVRLIRGETSHIKRAATTRLKVDDILQLRGARRQVADLIKSDEVTVLADFGNTPNVRSDGFLARVLLRNERRFNSTTGREVDFWRRYRARPVGLEADRVKSARLGREPLNVGEIVLLQLSDTALDRLRRHPDLIVLDSFEDEFDTRRMWTAGLIVAAVVAIATLTPLPIVIAALGGVLAMMFTGCLARDDLYSGVAWNVIFLLAGIIPLGIAMTKSGAAAWLASLLVANAGSWPPLLVLMSIYIMTSILTEMISNNAAVVILVPVAISVAEQLQLPPLPLVLVVMFAASTSFLTPVGYQTNTMIYGTGLYRFSDFLRLGVPLNILLLIITPLVIHQIWL